MNEKYNMDLQTATESRILTSDVYLVAFLLTRRCRLAKIMKNDRRRVSFLVEGYEVADLRRAYKKGPVSVNVRFFRDKLLTVRRLMDDKQRSAGLCVTIPEPHH